MKAPFFDTVVVGLGAVGSAVLYQLSKKKGLEILGIDQYEPPHQLGSSHGETRITRLAVGEGEDYVKLAKRSHEIWEEIEAAYGEKIRTKTGGILLDSGRNPWSKHGVEGFWERTLRFAKNQHVAYRIFGPEELQQSYPAFILPSTGKIYWEQEAGYLFPELALQAQLHLAKKNGASVWTSSKVQSILQKESYFQLELDGKVVHARQVVLSAGGWVKDFLPKGMQPKLKICRQVLYWLAIEDGFDGWERYPVWMWGFGPNPEDFIYGFPSLDGKTVKMASESFLEVTHPDQLNRIVSEEEKEIFWREKVMGKINGLKKEVVKSAVCFYTVTEDARFLIEPMEGNPNFLWISACSGHGFKHSAALGEEIVKRLGY